MPNKRFLFLFFSHSRPLLLIYYVNPWNWSRIQGLFAWLTMQCKAKGSSVFFVLLLIVWDQKKGRKGSKAAKKESVCEESRAVDWRGDFFAFSRLNFPPLRSLVPGLHCFCQEPIGSCFCKGAPPGSAWSHSSAIPFLFPFESLS